MSACSSFWANLPSFNNALLKAAVRAVLVVPDILFIQYVSVSIR